MGEPDRHASRLDEAEKQVRIVLNQLDTDHPSAGELLFIADEIGRVQDDIDT